ncbi:MAG: phosphoribosyl-ATP diphosphatase [Alphaproteobacteria bacterium]|nr:phosphoribosyl-ATP diphosphatase [Alphaproteobacteria bacterium]
MDLHQLEKIIAERLAENSDNSYSAQLWREGQARIAKKFGEEAVETLIEGVKGDKCDRDLLISESVDMLFHWLLLLKSNGVSVDEIYAEINKRHQQKNV